jgi:hypothetical protein
MAAGRGNTFAYTGAAGTSPLPIYLANFVTGIRPGDSADPAKYTGTNWTNTARLAELASRNPNPAGAASTLWGNATFRTNMAAAGYPRNFFVLNPDVNNANVTTNGNSTKYDSLQITWRRSLSDGLAVDANYVMARRYASTLDTLREDRILVQDTRGVPHALKLTAIYDLPFGQGRRYGANVNPWVDAAIGGWALNLAARVQSGTVVNLGNVRLVGMTEDELKDVYKVRIDPANANNVWMLPQDIIDNTIRAFSVSATSSTGYGALGPPTGRYFAPANGPDCIQQVRGDCAPHDVFVQGPAFTRFDLNARKRFVLSGRKSIEFAVDVLNLFDAINFNPVGGIGTDPDNYRVTQSYQDPNVTFDPGGRLMQLVFRFNW